jgi:hypothetical protein
MASAGHKDVRRLDVAVNNAFRIDGIGHRQSIPR